MSNKHNRHHIFSLSMNDFVYIIEYTYTYFRNVISLALTHTLLRNAVIINTTY